MKQKLTENILPCNCGQAGRQAGRQAGMYRYGNLPIYDDQYINYKMTDYYLVLGCI